MDFKIAGCVILYNPDVNVIENIASYIHCLDILYVVNNQGGDKIAEELSQIYKGKIIYIMYQDNKGIAYSLNEVLRLAEDNYDFLLTMDQDSRFYLDSMLRFKNEISSFDWRYTLSIGSSIQDYNFNGPLDENLSWREVSNMITSGSIVSIKNAIGGYDEKLFIDEVDFEFCYRGRDNGFVLYANDKGIYLLHSLGSPTFHKCFGRTTKVLNHNRIRKYYIFRNRLVVLFKYAKIIGARRCWSYYIKANIEMVRDIILYEDDKINKLKYVLLGLSDFFFQRLGKRF